VFGGINSGVTEETTSIFLESAYFNPISIRKTAKRHSLSTDASFRFERGIDPNIADYALRHAAILILQVAGGQITSDLVDIYPDFGGINSGVTEETTSIFLKSAYFNPISIRKTAKRHSLSTDASFRFERGIDPNIADYALRHAAILILQVAGGQITSDLVDIY